MSTVHVNFEKGLRVEFNMFDAVVDVFFRLVNVADTIYIMLCQIEQQMKKRLIC